MVDLLLEVRAAMACNALSASKDGAASAGVAGIAAKRSTSALLIKPWGPDPGTAERSMPSCLARTRAAGAAMIGPEERVGAAAKVFSSTGTGVVTADWALG